jgi:hypothetical protein
MGLRIELCDVVGASRGKKTFGLLRALPVCWLVGEEVFFLTLVVLHSVRQPTETGFAVPTGTVRSWERWIHDSPLLPHRQIIPITTFRTILANGTVPSCPVPSLLIAESWQGSLRGGTRLREECDLPVLFLLIRMSHSERCARLPLLVAKYLVLATGTSSSLPS